VLEKVTSSPIRTEQSLWISKVIAIMNLKAPAWDLT
jgi:hypothetical protein